MRINRSPDPGPFTNYRAYKPHLVTLFRRRCAYCLTPEDRCGGYDGMTVDHFWPRDRYGHLLHSWANLYYSCTICNSHYKKNHPTEGEEAQGYRFVDPCQQDPDDHFRLERDWRNGGICHVRALSDEAEYTLRILRFNFRRSLRDFWRELERLERNEQRRLSELDQLLAMLRQDIEQRGSSRDIETVRRELVTQKDACVQRLKELQSQRAFPAD